jgi:hypothetical protein
MMFDTGGELRLFLSTDGVTGAEWTGVINGRLVETNPTWPSTVGQSLVYRNSIVWIHSSIAGGAGTGKISSYDLNLSTLTRTNPDVTTTSICIHSLHVHKNKLFLFGNGGGGNQPQRLLRLDAGTWTLLHAGVNNSGASTDLQSFSTGHTCMFTDPATGDLIAIAGGASPNFVGSVGNKVWRFTNVETGSSSTPTMLHFTVFGSVEGGDKYLQDTHAQFRRWVVNVDTESDPANPRIFLTTWRENTTNTETWEWKGVGAEIEAVASLSGISSDFALPTNSVGGGHRLPRVAGIEIGDTANPPEEAAGGTKFFFRGVGSSAAGVVTFRGTDTEGTPSTVIPIVNVVVESGSPPTTPTVSSNTLINFTPDNGATLYSAILNVAAAGVDIGEGDVGLIVAGLVV